MFKGGTYENRHLINYAFSEKNNLSASVDLPNSEESKEHWMIKIRVLNHRGKSTFEKRRNLEKNSIFEAEYSAKTIPKRALLLFM